jgi:hypothetical protein
MSDIQEEMKRQYKRAEENDIKLLQEENKKLKELCDKYEEEHKTTFEEWKKDINIIDELEKYLKENESDEDNCNTITYTELLDKLNELKGDNK